MGNSRGFGIAYASNSGLVRSRTWRQDPPCPTSKPAVPSPRPPGQTRSRRSPRPPVSDPRLVARRTGSCSEFPQRWSQLAVGLQRERLQRGEDLDADVVRPGFEVLTYAIGYGVRFAPSNYGVDQSVAPSPGKVITSEAQRFEIVLVVREGKIASREFPRRPSRRACVLLQHHADLRGQQRIGSQDLTSSSCVFDRYEIGVGTRGSIGRQTQHPRSEGGEYPPLSRHGRPGTVEGVEGVEGVEVGHHVAVRAAVALCESCMADTQTEDEPPGMAEIEVSGSTGDFVRGRRPDAHDATAHHHPSGCAQQSFEMRREAGLESARGPKGCVAKLFQLGSDISRGILGGPPCTAPPDAYSPEIHRITLPALGIITGGRLRTPVSSAGSVGRPDPWFLAPQGEHLGS